MSRRKRTNSTDSNSYTSPAKRRATSSSARNNRQDASFGSQGKLWKVRDIISENRTQYLIDWEDDPETGEKFKPTWEPKAYANAVAIAAWEQNQKDTRSSKSALRSSVTSKSQPPRKAPAPLRTSRRGQAIESSSPTKENQQTQVESTQETSGVSESQLQQSLPPSSEQPDLRVEITPHSCLDPEQYRLFLASQSVQAQQSSQQDQADSGFDESSPISASPQYPVQVQSGVVPDSQSIPNSSSYLPTDSKSSSSVFQTSGEDNRSGFIDPRLLTQRESSSVHVSADSDPIEDISSSQGFSEHFIIRHRQLSEPVVIQDSRRHSRGLCSSSDLHVRSTASSPAVSLPAPGRQSIRGSQASPRLEIAGSRARPLVSSVFEPGTQGTSGIVRPNTATITNDNLNREDLQPVLGQDILNGHNTDTLAFQTQIPLPFDDQYSEFARESPSTAGEIWQSAQNRTAAASLHSERSSVSRAEYLSKSGGAPRSRHQPLDRLLSPRRPSASDQSTQDPTASNTPGNSQSGQRLHSAQPKEDIAFASVESPDLIVEEITSSIGLVAPSQPPTVLDLKPPQPVSTPSEIEMSDGLRPAMGSSLQDLPPQSPIGGPAPSLREKLRNLRAASAAEALARRQSLEASPAVQTTKSPSVIPELSPKGEVGDSRIEVRAIDIPRPQRPSGPHTPINPSKLHLHNEISQLPIEHALEKPKLGLMEYVVPLPLPARVKDQYVQLLDYYKTPIQMFQETPGIDDTLTTTIQTLINRLNHVTTHIDLDNDTTLTQQDVTPEMQVMWAIDSSAKFLFLQYLVRFMRGQDCHVVIIAEGGRLLDLLEVFLQGLRVGYNRPDNSSISVSDNVLGGMQISLLATGEDSTSTLSKSPTLVIAFDASFDSNNPDIEAVRNFMLNAGQYAPVVHLLVYASAEHIIRCIPRSVQGLDRLKAVLNCVSQNSEEIGKLTPDEYNPRAAAEEVAAFVKAGSLPYQWTVFPIRALAIDMATEDMSRQTSSSTQSEAKHGSEVNEAGMSTGKRPLSTTEDKYTPEKRQRTVPGPEVTHISDSMTQSTAQSAQAASQTIVELQFALQQAEKDNEDLKGVHGNEEKKLQTTLHSTQQQLQEYFNALSGLQDRYEERNNQYHALRHEKDDLLAAAASSDRKREALIAENTKLKNERKALDEQLNQARAALQTSTNPQIAHLEGISAANRALTQERDSLEKRLASMTRDFDFTRQQYQLASSAAAEAASRVSDLESENEILRKKASGEMVKAKQMTVQMALALQQADMEKAEAENAEMKELLRKKERGRGVVTRTGSVAPKSPRLGGSPGRSRQGSKAPGSRGVSPVRGFLGVRKGRGPVD
ncbi:hypothetical protein MMC30_002892 [Trapelia coarctata]|nr:hypothetical protein [Trapelia coarctata]